MGSSSKIEWTQATWTPIRARRLDPSGKELVGWHCEHVSEGCRNCYAESMNKRLGTGLEFKPGNHDEVDLFLDEKMLRAPLSWRKPRMIFVCSMTDLFADFVSDEWIDRMFAVMALCPQHTFQLLSKRPARMLEWSRINSTGGHIFHVAQQIDTQKHGARSGKWPLPNVWLGTSCEDQATADARIPDLLATPAAVRFVSCEPLLAPIDLIMGRANRQPDGKGYFSRLDWVICGGESGHGARPMYPAWARSLRDQCAAAMVPFFFKQFGNWTETYSPGGDGATHWVDETGKLSQIENASDWPNGAVPIRNVGKKRAGRLLDGVEHDGFPEARA